MQDAFKDLEQDFTKALKAVAKGAGDTPRKKRGAPTGNQNARKHGFYSKRLTPEQQAEYEMVRHADLLAEEINLMRYKITTFMDDPNTDPQLLLRAVWVLARMVRIEERVRYGS